MLLFFFNSLEILIKINISFTKSKNNSLLQTFIYYEKQPNGKRVCTITWF